jgi:hypothetical protein
MAISKTGRLVGGTQILKNFRKEVKNIKGDISTGLRLGLAHIEGEAVENAPVEFGVLRNSAFHWVRRTMRRISGRVGFTAEYAPFVHEMPEINKGKPRPAPKRGSFWQGGGNKFLERAVIENLSAVLSLIKRKARR